MTEEERLLAEFAANVARTLKATDDKMQGSTANGPANRINPRDFIPTQPGQRGVRPAQQPNVIKGLDMIEAPKSTPTGADVHGTVSVPINDLMIPMDGLDADMRRAIAAHSAPAQAQVPIPIPEPIRQPEAPTVEQVQALGKQRKPKKGEPGFDMAEARKAFNYVKRKLVELEKKVDQLLETKCECK